MRADRLVAVLLLLQSRGRVTAAEVAKLLTTAGLIDGRTLTEAEVNLWHRLIGHLDAGQAMDALLEHLQESSYPVKPADIIQRARQARARRQEREGIHPRPPAGRRWAVDVIESGVLEAGTS